MEGLEAIGKGAGKAVKSATMEDPRKLIGRMIREGLDSGDFATFDLSPKPKAPKPTRVKPEAKVGKQFDTKG